MHSKISAQTHKLCSGAIALFFVLLGTGLFLSQRSSDSTPLPLPVRRYAASVEQFEQPQQTRCLAVAQSH